MVRAAPAQRGQVDPGDGRGAGRGAQHHAPALHLPQQRGRQGDVLGAVPGGFRGSRERVFNTNEIKISRVRFRENMLFLQDCQGF